MEPARKAGERRLHGSWAHLTLDALLETAVRARPGKRSFTDAPDLATWSDLTAKATTVGDLGALVTRFAGQVRSLGLKAGDVVLVAMPNCVDGVVCILGLIAAGYIPCPVSVVADAQEMQNAAEASQARAIITVNRYADFLPSEVARLAASRYYGLRFICAFGPGAPSGVVSLDNWADSELSQTPLPINDAASPALMTLERRGDEVVAHTRSHAQLISDALALSAISGLTGRGSIIATFAPVSAAGFVSTVASPLISGSYVALHGPFDAGVLHSQLVAQPDAIVVLPAAVEDAVRKAMGSVLKDTIVVTRDLNAIRPKTTDGRVTEFVSLGETALWALLRDPSRSRIRLPRFYGHPVGTALPRTSPQLEISMSARGRLMLSGFGVSTAATDEATAGPVETNWMARSDGPDHMIVTADDADAAHEAAGFAVAAA